MLKAGGNGTWKLQHAAVNEDEAFKDLAGGSVLLNATDNHVLTIPSFLRYVRWVTDSAVAGDPLALADLIAKE